MNVNKARLAKIEDLPRVELRTYRLYDAAGRPLPVYLRYVGGAWWAFIGAEGLRELGLDGATSIIVTAWTPREAADALYKLLLRLGVRVERPEYAELP
jgi:hypothetical protein